MNHDHGNIDFIVNIIMDALIYNKILEWVKKLVQ